MRKFHDAKSCIELILRDIEKRQNVDYADRNSVRRYNAAYDRIDECANYLYDYYPESFDLYLDLVNHTNYSISAVCTTVLYNLRNATPELKALAIDSAKRLLTHPESGEVERFAWSVNILRWESALQSIEKSER